MDNQVLLLPIGQGHRYSTYLTVTLAMIHWPTISSPHLKFYVNFTKTHKNNTFHIRSQTLNPITNTNITLGLNRPTCNLKHISCYSIFCSTIIRQKKNEEAQIRIIHDIKYTLMASIRQFAPDRLKEERYVDVFFSKRRFSFELKQR